MIIHRSSNGRLDWYWYAIPLVVAVAWVVFLLLITLGCGGSPMAHLVPVPADPSPVALPPSNDPPPATVPTVPTNWSITDLVPLPGFNASQANAVNAAGVVVGYSESPDGTTEATEWIDGHPIDLGPGIATAINDSGVVAGYSINPDSSITAHIWVSGVKQDIGNGWFPEGINSAGMVVGPPLDFGPAISWRPGGALEQIPSCQAALAVNDSGQIAGISMNGGNATICGDTGYMQLGAATAINSSGQTVGYVNPSAVEANAVLFPSTQLAVSGLATGINDLGWVVGETITGGSGNVLRARLDRYRTARSTGIRETLAHLAGQSHPWIWSKETGLMSLPDPLITAEGISGNPVTTGSVVTRVVGAGLATDGTIHGMLLSGQ